MRPPPALAGVAAGGRTFANLLSGTEWMLPSPATQVHTISVLPSHSPPSSPRHFAFSNLTTAPKRSGCRGEEEGSARFEVVRDDLLHPLANGNKARKLDALLPLLSRRGTTDVVTCGGCQSAHAAATAVHCAEWGMRPHILLRGEQPDVPTGYNLISLMFGNVTYASRSVYAQRDEMLYDHARKVAGTGGTVWWADDIDREDSLDEDTGCEIGSRRVVIIKEGAGDVQALLGVVRLVEYLYNLPSFQKHEKVHIVVDAGTGTTAVGLALGAVCLGLHWKVTAVMLADTLERYKEREKSLISDFKKLHHNNCHEIVGENDNGDSLVEWVERFSPRRFGKVLSGEIALCRQIAQQTGILLDPMYTLAGWEQAVDLSVEDGRTKVVMIHTGGTLGLFGLAQRYSQHFTSDEQT
uniref:D-cysteine desulfhydrase n=1 Tax=Leersia perrieri TaxID=77586 RepID=A0A0D9V4H9_9ORYZ